MRILACGSRDWIDLDRIREALLRVACGVTTQVTLIHGAARGADSLAGMAAEALGWDVVAFPADWKKYGKGAGPRRNQQMLDEGKPNVVVAFHDDIGNSKGTQDMIRRARYARVPVLLVSLKGVEVWTRPQ